MTEIRKARKEDLPDICRIYGQIHAREEEPGITCGWIRGVYPTEAIAAQHIADGDMYVMTSDNVLVASGIINHKQGEEYEQAKWMYEAAPDKVMVLHALAVSAEAKGHGYGRQFVAFYEQLAKGQQCEYLRMVTLEQNATARNFYHKLGYTEVDAITCYSPPLRMDVRLVFLEKKICKQ